MNRATRPWTSRQFPTCPFRMFLSAAPADESILERLLVHLALHQQRRFIDCWYPEQGENQEAEVRLAAADIVVVLVSADFFATAARSRELTRALSRKAHVVPVIVRAVDLTHSSLSQLQFLPNDGIPVSESLDKDAAWVSVVRSMLSVLLVP